MTRSNRDSSGPGFSLVVSRALFAPASDAAFVTGLIGHLRFVLNGECGVGGVAVRRKRDRSICFSFPRQRDARGRIRHVFWPLTEEARLHLEGQLLAQLYPLLVRRGLVAKSPSRVFPPPSTSSRETIS